MVLNRRQFVVNTAASAAASAMLAPYTTETVGAPRDPQGERLPIVDTHQHLWDLKRFRLPWLESAPQILKRDYLIRDYQDAVAGLNVVRAIYMEVDVAPDQQSAEADYVLDICRSPGSVTAGAVISGRPNSPAFVEYIRKYRDQPLIKGVRQVLHSPDARPGLCLEPQFVQSIQLLGEFGKSFDLCLRPGELGDAIRLVDRCPGTRFILDHCGNADPKAFLTDESRGAEPPGHSASDWRRDITELARREQVVCKISGIVARAPKSGWTAEILAPIINHCLESFGPDRVVFGGDWPVCLLGASYRRWVESLLEVIANRPESEQRRLLHDNAVRLYRLSAV